MTSSAPSSNSEGTCGGSQAPSGCWAHVHMRVWAYPRLQAPRTPSGATLGQAKTCLHVQRSDAACQGGLQLSAGESPQLCVQDADNVCPGEGWAAPGWDKSGPQAALPGRAPASSATAGRAWGCSISPAGFGAPRPLSSASLSLSACFVPPTASRTLLGAFLLGPQLLHP